MPHANLMTILYYSERRQHAVAGGHLPPFCRGTGAGRARASPRRLEGDTPPGPVWRLPAVSAPGDPGAGPPVPRSGGGNPAESRRKGGGGVALRKVPACRDPEMPPRTRTLGAVSGRWGGWRCRPLPIAAVSAALTPERSGAAVPRHAHPPPTSHLQIPCPAPGTSAGVLPRSPPPAKQPSNPNSSGFVSRRGAGGGASTAGAVPVAKFEAAPPSPKRRKCWPVAARHWSQSRPAAGRRSLVRLSHRNAALPACCVKGQEGYFFLYRCICF